MKIATYNVNGVNGHLRVLLRWLEESKPDVACLQELKAPQEKFPLEAIQAAGYNAIWHGQKSWNGVAILSRHHEISEIRRSLPGDPEDMHSRYIEAVVNNITVGCLYLPNGNPAPGQNSITNSAGWNGLPVMRMNFYPMAIQLCLPATITLYPMTGMCTSPNAGWKMHCFARRFGQLLKYGWSRAGPMPCVNFIRKKRYIPTGIIFVMPTAVMQVCALIIFCLVPTLADASPGPV